MIRAWRTTLARSRSRLLRVIVLAIALPLASAGALPLWAQLFAVEGPHVCHCSLDHHDCVCPRCNTDPDAAQHLSSESLKGRCGDDEVAFGGKAFRAIGPSALVLVLPPRVARLSVLEPAALLPRDRGRPPTPPPRQA